MVVAVRIDQKGFRLGAGVWVAAAGLAVVVAAALWWRHDMSDAPSTDPGSATNAAAAGVVPAVAAETTASVPELDAHELMSQTAQAAKVVAQSPEIAPVTGPVTERPDYVSVIEWMAMKSAAAQHPDPDRELTRMVNFLRFMRQQEVLEGLAPTETAKRQELASALLRDLPERVVQGDIGLPEAHRMQADWLAIVEPDAARREVLAQQEAARLPAAPAKSATSATQGATTGSTGSAH